VNTLATSSPWPLIHGEREALVTDLDGLWIAWPKRAAGLRTDMTERVVRQIALPAGLVGNKVCARPREPVPVQAG
jgi:hypothetical protein